MKRVPLLFRSQIIFVNLNYKHLLDMGTNTKNRATGKKKTIVNKTTNDYANDPFFIKKREEALKLLKKTGLPDSFTKKK